jgi:hypothetical protein
MEFFFFSVKDIPLEIQCVTCPVYLVVVVGQTVNFMFVESCNNFIPL